MIMIWVRVVIKVCQMTCLFLLVRPRDKFEREPVSNGGQCFPRRYFLGGWGPETTVVLVFSELK